MVGEWTIVPVWQPTVNAIITWLAQPSGFGATWGTVLAILVIFVVVFVAMGGKL